MSEALLIKSQSPVEDQTSFLYKWDSLVRKNFWKYEADKKYLQDGIASLYTNPLTRFRDPVQFGHRYADLESLRLRQQLGQISGTEISELNFVFGGQYGISLKRDGQLFATNKPVLAGVFASCSALAVYAKFVKGYSIIWLVGSYSPFFATLCYNKVRQPSQLINNCYNYLITKRAATVEIQNNYTKFNENEFTKTSEFKALRN